MELDNAGTEEAFPETEVHKYTDSISKDLDFNGQIMRILIQDVMAGNDLTGESGGISYWMPYINGI